MEISDVLKSAQTKSDFGVILVAGVAGFVVDGLLGTVGIFSPGVVGGLSASGALGLKKLAESAWQRRKESSERRGSRQVADALLAALEREGQDQLAARLRVLAGLFDDQVITAAQFEEAMAEGRNQLVAAVGAGPP